jgi:hypothetical protein
MSNKPRRQSKRWLDADCPKGVLAIYDHPKFADSYTVFYAEPLVAQGDTWISYRSMSENPFSPQGVGLYCEMKAYQVAAYRYSSRHKAAKWSSLPDKVKRCVLQDLKEELAA